jgi:hypothetical protein
LAGKPAYFPFSLSFSSFIFIREKPWLQLGVSDWRGVWTEQEKKKKKERKRWAQQRANRESVFG